MQPNEHNVDPALALLLLLRRYDTGCVTVVTGHDTGCAAAVTGVWHRFCTAMLRCYPSSGALVNSFAPSTRQQWLRQGHSGVGCQGELQSLTGSISLASRSTLLNGQLLVLASCFSCCLSACDLRPAFEHWGTINQLVYCPSTVFHECVILVSF